MEHYIPALLCCLHYRLEASPLQPFATTLYLHTRRWEWIFYPHELALTLDLYHALKQIPRRIRQYLTFKTRPGNEGNFSHDYLVRSICNQLKRIIDRPRVEPEWPQFLLSSQFPLREFPYALNRGLTEMDRYLEKHASFHHRRYNLDRLSLLEYHPCIQSCSLRT